MPGLMVEYQDREYEANIDMRDAKPIYSRFLRTHDSQSIE